MKIRHKLKKMNKPELLKAYNELKDGLNNLRVYEPDGYCESCEVDLCYKGTMSNCKEIKDLVIKRSDIQSLLNMF